MGKKTALAFFALAYALTLLVTMPASVLDAVLQSSTQGRLALANAHGTVWHGSASPALRQQEGRYITLTPLHWDIAALPLFSGKIIATLRWDEAPGAAAMEAILSPTQIELRHVFIPLPAKVLSEASPILKPAEFRGQMQVQGEHLLFSKRGMEGAATVDWRQAGSALSRVAPLGDYHLALDGSGERINIGLSTISGALLLQGQGNWSAGRGLDFHGRAQASAGARDKLGELLHHLGPEVSPGVHGFNLVPQ